MVPKHKDPTNPKRTAVAPYNFVSVPDRVMAYVDSEESPRRVDHSAYHGNRLTGWIDVELETRSPLYIRGPLTPAEYEEMEEQEKGDNTPNLQKLRNKPDFFHTGDPNSPAIPGSSIRGMLRTLTQILGYGKLSPVSDTNLVYRAIVDKSYRDLLIDEVSKNHFVPRVQGGYIERDDSDRWYIRPAKEVHGTTYARISHTKIPGCDPEKALADLKKHGNCKSAYRIFIKIGPYDFQPVRKFLRVKYSKVEKASEVNTDGSLQSAVLAFSGQMQKKGSEAVIFEKAKNADRIRISEDLIAAYRDQLSLEQKQLLGENGVLQPDHPVLYQMKNERLVFFGHTQMFRMPYQHSPQEMLPHEHWDNRKRRNLFSRDQMDRENRTETKILVDYAEAIYGSSKDEDSGQAGRIFISDAHLKQSQGSPWLTDSSVIIPKILSGPKPTTFQHYLTQTEPDVARGQGLHTYNDSPRRTTLRGFKMYWHKGDVQRQKFEERGEFNAAKDTQHTKIKPVRSGIKFQFRVRFENLLLDELGLLWWTLALPADGEYCHKIGMAKPLGLGAIKLSPKLVLTNPTDRYRSLLSQDERNWDEAIVPKEQSEELLNRAVSQFEGRVLKFNKKPIGTSFSELERVGEFLDMLSWPGPQPPEELTRYFEIEYRGPNGNLPKRNEYRDRPVLPSPPSVLAQTSEGTPQLQPTTPPQARGNQITGKVKFYNDAKGFGFIVRDDGGADVFVHRSQLVGGLAALEDGQRVLFKIGPGRKGPQAEDVRLET